MGPRLGGDAVIRYFSKAAARVAISGLPSNMRRGPAASRSWAWQPQFQESSACIRFMFLRSFAEHVLGVSQSARSSSSCSTKRQIGQRPFISLHAAETHAPSVYAKLTAHSRA